MSEKQDPNKDKKETVNPASAGNSSIASPNENKNDAQQSEQKRQTSGTSFSSVEETNQAKYFKLQKEIETLKKQVETKEKELEELDKKSEVKPTVSIPQAIDFKGDNIKEIQEKEKTKVEQEHDDSMGGIKNVS